jgi:hypothetical protein
MTPNTPSADLHASSLEGKVMGADSRDGLLSAVELAFDYRGDVTVELKDGTSCEGYVYNRNHDQGVLDLFVKGQTAPRSVPYAKVSRIVFSGEDTAFGKTWESWKSKTETQRADEARKARTVSEALGHL